jgi:hypothetical protein
MKRVIESNKGYYLLSQSTQYYLLSSCDQNICEKCYSFAWIVNIIYKRFDKKNFNNIQITLCLPCLQNSDFIAKIHHCPFHNTHVNEDAKICESCFDKMKEKTEELYKKEFIHNHIAIGDTYIEM